MLDRTPSFILDPAPSTSHAAASSAAPGDGALLDAFSTAVTDVVDRLGPAVVKVEAKPNPQSRRPSGHGSGFIISPDGLALTNSHVVQGAREMRLTTSDGRTVDAQVLGDDPDTDLAVLRAAGARSLPSCGLATRSASSAGNSSSRSAIRSASSRRSRPASS